MFVSSMHSNYGYETNPVSPMQGSTSNQRHEGGENQSSESHEYIDVEVNETNDQNLNDAASVEDTQNDGGEDDVVPKNKRQKNSVVWGDFIEVTLPDGKAKVECIHCKKQLAKIKTGTTSTYKRHMTNCLQRKQYLRTQQLLNFQPIDVDKGINKPPFLIGPDGKYDAGKMRESIAHWIMATEQPFNTVEDEMFVYMMKTANPMFERVSRATIKADCFKVYEHEEKKLKSLVNSTSNISLTTDCWKSSHQKIEYMVITGHFIDQNWRFD